MTKHPALTRIALGFLGGILAAPILVAIAYFVEQHEVRKMGKRAVVIQFPTQRDAEVEAAIARHPAGKGVTR